MAGTGTAIGAGAASVLPGGSGIGAIVGNALEREISKVIKGKGTPHHEVFAKMPKFFYAYGSGDYGGVPAKFTNAIPEKGLFTMESGKWLAGLSSGEGFTIYKAKGGIEAEKAARKPGERVTKDAYFTMLTVPGNYYRGMTSVNGIKYDVNFLENFRSFPDLGAMINQYQLAPTVNPKPDASKLPEGDKRKPDVPVTPTNGTKANFAPIAFIGLAIKLLSGK